MPRAVVAQKRIPELGSPKKHLTLFSKQIRFYILFFWDLLILVLLGWRVLFIFTMLFLVMRG